MAKYNMLHFKGVVYVTGITDFTLIYDKLVYTLELRVLIFEDVFAISYSFSGRKSLVIS